MPGAALTTLNDLVGGMSPYGSSGAQELIDSVSEVGARYFEQVSHERALPWLAVIPLADAVTLPACPWPRNVIFVPAFHGGLLGNASVRQLVEGFLSRGAAQVDRRVPAAAAPAPPSSSRRRPRPGGCPNSARPVPPRGASWRDARRSGTLTRVTRAARPPRPTQQWWRRR